MISSSNSFVASANSSLVISQKGLAVVLRLIVEMRIRRFLEVQSQEIAALRSRTADYLADSR